VPGARGVRLLGLQHRLTVDRAVSDFPGASVGRVFGRMAERTWPHGSGLRQQ
jgi:hypothetical protein